MFLSRRHGCAFRLLRLLPALVLLAGLLSGGWMPVSAVSPGSIVHAQLHARTLTHHPADDGPIHFGEGCCAASSHAHAHADAAQQLSWALPPGASRALPDDHRRSVWAVYDRPFLPDPLPADLLRPPRRAV
jgi:hypothetical protein